MLLFFPAFIASCNQKRAPQSLLPIGHIRDYPLGETKLELYRLLIRRGVDSYGKHWLRAVSMVCTHQTCALVRRPEDFYCPCHGSRFGANGHVITGPAVTPLRWFRIQVETDGNVFVDMSSEVSYEHRAQITL